MMFGTSVGALTPTPSLTDRLAGSWRWLLTLLAIVAAPGVAGAQIENVTPFYVSAERDGVALQCRIGSASYPVKVLKAGDVLKVDGQSQTIYRVEYPAGMNAYVKIEEATLEEGGKTVKLTKPSRLMAPNTDGVSWWYLLEKDVAAGTTFAHQKTVKGADGKDAGYLVPAPVGSKAYIRRDFVRPATQAEIDKLLGKTTPEVKPADSPAVTAPKPAEPQPAESKPAETKPTEPTTTPGETKPATNVPPAPVTIDNQPSEKPPVVPAPTDTTPKPADAPKASSRLRAQTAETLNKLYSDALKTPLEQVELDAVIAEFERTIESLAKEEGTQRMRTQLGARVSVLKMRSELQATLRQTNTSSDALKQQSDQMKTELARLESLRQYTVVGRLVASSVYDGRQLPLMYRVLSPEPTSTRTLAYVAPEANSDLTDKVGKLVGVVGESKFDESLRVNIVVPTRVETLGAVTTPATPSTTPATPSPVPASPPPPATEPSANPATPAVDTNK